MPIPGLVRTRIHPGDFPPNDGCIETNVGRRSAGQTAVDVTIRSQAERPVVSRSSILILSGFLIGMVSSRMIHPALELPVYATGVLGVAAYLAADHRARGRERRVHVTIRHIERRMDRHVAGDGRFHLRPPLVRRRDSEHQYLTVVTGRC